MAGNSSALGLHGVAAACGLSPGQVTSFIISVVCGARWRRRKTWRKMAPPPLLPAPARCPRPRRWMPLRTSCARSARTLSTMKPPWPGAGTSSVSPAYWSGPAEELCARSASALSTTSTARREPATTRHTTSRSAMAPAAMLEEGDLGPALRKGGGGVPQATGTAGLPAGTAAVAAPGPQRGAEAGPRGGTATAMAGFGTPRATAPRAAGDSSRAGPGTRPATRAELHGPNRTSRPPRGGATDVSGEAGLPPGNGG